MELILTHPKPKPRLIKAKSKRLIDHEPEISNSQPALDFIPCVTIHPTKICLYKEVNRNGKPKHSIADVLPDNETIDINTSFLRSTRKNNGFLSDHAKRKLFKAIDYLLIMSERKKAYSKLQKKYISFRIVFVTLTLPSKQFHSDKEITNKCFNQLLVELAKYHNVKKYIWRAEKQENGNIHYHLLINEFIEWQILRKRWNRICNKLGYVDIYQKTQKEFFKNGFRLSNNPNDNRTVEQQRKAYIIGQKSNWTSPNSTDIHDTRKVRDIKKYVGKYMAKQPSVDLSSDTLESDFLKVDSRLWSCSQILSNVKGCQLHEDWLISDELEKVANESKCYYYRDTYFSVLCIDIHSVLKNGSELLFRYFSDYLIKNFNYHLPLKITM